MARVGTRGAGLSKDIALSVKNKLTHLGANVSDDLARLSGKVEDAFAYADGAVSKNIGKHNARVYQSNGGNWDEVASGILGSSGAGRKAAAEFSDDASQALAKHGDEVNQALKETGEQAGKKVGQEFSQETSEQLAKNSDDVAKGAKEAGEKNDIYPSTYDERINQTPVNNGSWTGDRGESKFISELDGVNDVLKKYDINGIEYKDGIPDFSPVSEGEVIHPDMSIDRNKNFRVADELLAEQLGVSRKEITKLRKQGKFTWHELNDMKTMQLIPSILNSKFGHLGGVAEVKKLLGL